MSFNLPRNAKGLRFTGSVRAIAVEQPPASAALGKRRPPKAQRPPLAPPAPKDRPREVISLEVFPTVKPLVHANGDLRGQRGESSVVIEEDIATLAMDRDGLDVLPGASRAPKPPTPLRPIPNFRPATIAPPDPPKVVVKNDATPKGPPRAPLALWILAAVVAGIVSYRIAPDAIERASSTVRVIER